VNVPSSEGEAYPVVLTPNTQLQKLECGYYDSGSFALRKLASVQPARFYPAVSQEANGMRQGYAGVWVQKKVPLGTTHFNGSDNNLLSSAVEDLSSTIYFQWHKYH
jgi:hypothetical protein